MGLRIKQMLSPKRCDICHKADCFDLERLSCSRCEGILGGQQLLANTKPYLTKEQAIKRIENRFNQLEKQRACVNRKKIFHLAVVSICLLPMDILLLNFHLGMNLGLLLILNILLISTGVIVAKRKATNQKFKTDKENHLVSGLIELSKIARKYRGKAISS